MTSLRTDHDARPPVSSAPGIESTGREDGRLSPVQVAAGALASVSAAVIGAALASVVSTVGAAIYSDSLRRTHAGIRRAHRLLRRGPTEGRPAGVGSLPPLPARLNPRRSPARRWRRRSILAGTAVGVFGLAIGIVTAVELIGQKPVSALVGGSGHPGGTTIGTLTEAIEGGQPQPAPAASDITVPGPSTAGSPPASESSPTPTPTASRESAATDARASTSASDGAASTASSPASSAGNRTGSAAPTQAADASSAAASPPAAASTAPAEQPDAGAGQAPSVAAPTP